MKRPDRRPRARGCRLHEADVAADTSQASGT